MRSSPNSNPLRSPRPRRVQPDARRGTDTGRVGRPWRKSELLSKTTKEDLLVLAELLESGGATPVTYRTHPLSETAAAIAYVGYRTIEGPF